MCEVQSSDQESIQVSRTLEPECVTHSLNFLRPFSHNLFWKPCSLFQLIKFSKWTPILTFSNQQTFMSKPVISPSELGSASYENVCLCPNKCKGWCGCVEVGNNDLQASTLTPQWLLSAAWPLQLWFFPHADGQRRATFRGKRRDQCVTTLSHAQKAHHHACPMTCEKEVLLETFHRVLNTITLMG